MGIHGLLWVDDEYRADGERNTLAIDVGDILVIQHIVLVRNLSGLIANDWELQVGIVDLVDILDPLIVLVNGVGGEANQLDVALCELWLELCESTELGGADGGEVVWMGEENDPGVADELVEVDLAGGGLGLEIWGDAAQAESEGRVLAGVGGEDENELV